MIALAYAGVHQIFQLALAAHEMDSLEGLFCSLVDGPGKWGRRLGGFAPIGTKQPLGWDAIPQDRMTEFPWPLLLNRLGKRFLKYRHSDYYHSNKWFDSAASRWLEQSKAQIFVGGETCALKSLHTAARHGMKRVLDCPGIPTSVLYQEALLATEDFKVPTQPVKTRHAMQERKHCELMQADVVLCCSEFQRRKLVELNPGIRQTKVIPLWTDVEFWSEVARRRTNARADGPLRVLYAGGITLQKGVPYLLEAVEPLKKEVQLSLVGYAPDPVKPILAKFRAHDYHSHMSKAELRDLAARHDVLVAPSLGDSFSFVVMEAMAAGMPVIVTQNVGAPVPDENWRIPVRDSAALRERLLWYSADRSRVLEDAGRASAFASTFTPDRYRAEARSVFESLLVAA